MTVIIGQLHNVFFVVVAQIVSIAKETVSNHGLRTVLLMCMCKTKGEWPLRSEVIGSEKMLS